MGSFRVFGLTLFAIAAIAVLVVGWRNGEPWTAAAFVVFFSSRVARAVIKRPLSGVRTCHPIEDAHRFLLVTAGGWLASAALGLGAAVAGEGQEWLYVAPCFLIFGTMNLYVALRRG